MLSSFNTSLIALKCVVPQIHMDTDRFRSKLYLRPFFLPPQPPLFCRPTTSPFRSFLSIYWFVSCSFLQLSVVFKSEKKICSQNIRKLSWQHFTVIFPNSNFVSLFLSFVTKMLVDYFSFYFVQLIDLKVWERCCLGDLGNATWFQSFYFPFVVFFHIDMLFMERPDVVRISSVF